MEPAPGDPFNTRDNEVGERLSCFASSFKLMGFGERVWPDRETADFFDSTLAVSHLWLRKNNSVRVSLDPSRLEDY